MFLLTALLSGPALFAQGSKNENIRVPSEALKPAYTKEYFDNNLKDFKAWLESLEQLPDSCVAAAAELQKDRDIYTSKGVFSDSIIDYLERYLRNFDDAQLREAISGSKTLTMDLVKQNLHVG